MTCSEPKCQKPSRARGMCAVHYEKQRRRQRKHRTERLPKPTWRSRCQHLDCNRRVAVIFTWPYPILRHESHCRPHANRLMNTVVPGLQFEELGTR